MRCISAGSLFWHFICKGECKEQRIIECSRQIFLSPDHARTPFSTEASISVVWGQVEISTEDITLIAHFWHFLYDFLWCYYQACRNLNVQIYFAWWAKLIMDYLLKLQGHISMSNLIRMPWLYFVVLTWWFNVLSLSAVLVHHSCRILPPRQCYKIAWRVRDVAPFLRSNWDLKFRIWSENKPLIRK